MFVDLKLHDIPHTVERATAQIAKLGATFLTVHAYPQTMQAALAGAAGSGLKLLGVSALTSADDSDLAQAGYALERARVGVPARPQAEEIGLAGLVASAAEAATLRAEGRKLTLVCPGIRPAGDEAGDQKRVATPARAIADGADYLVIGRPITAAPDPRAAAERIVAEMRAKPSRLQFAVPVEVIHPARVQVVGREQAPVLVQVVDGRLVGLAGGEHARLRPASCRPCANCRRSRRRPRSPTR